jgi:predicted lipoprotein with Yx(FWY)xxD motif
MQGTRLVSTTIVVALVGISCAAAAAARPHSAAAKPAPTVSVRSTSSYGKILVNSKGYTLYLWTKDKPNKSACSGPCLGVWPFVLVSGTPTGGPGVNAKLLGTITVTVNGKTEHEVTYNKHPLYTFISDVKAGIISGEGSKQFPPAWWLVSPAGNAITKKT